MRKPLFHGIAECQNRRFELLHGRRCLPKRLYHFYSTHILDHCSHHRLAVFRVAFKHLFDIFSRHHKAVDQKSKHQRPEGCKRKRQTAKKHHRYHDEKAQDM